MKLEQRLSFIGTSILAGIASILFGTSLKYVEPNPDDCNQRVISLRYYISPVVSGLIFCLTWTLSGSRRFPLITNTCLFLLRHAPWVTVMLIFHEYTVYERCFELVGVCKYANPFCVNRNYPDVLEPDPAWILYFKGCILNLVASFVSVFHASTYLTKVKEEEPIKKAETKQESEEDPTKKAKME